MPGIVGYGAFIPRNRIKSEEIAHQWGKDPATIQRGLLLKEKSVPGLDEDTITISVAAGRSALVRAGILHVAGLVNPSAASGLTTALIGINIESRGQLAQQLEKLTSMKQVHWAVVVTGRFDIIAEVVVKGGMEDLYTFTSVDLPAVGRVTHCETFVVMRSSRKWIFLPDGL